MQVSPVNQSISQQNFGLKTDKLFDFVVKQAKHEVKDYPFINSKIWDYTKKSIKKIKKTFPDGILFFKETEFGIIPILQPTGKLPFYKKNSDVKPRTIQLKTILLSNGTSQGKSLRNLARELCELQNELK